MTDSELKPKNFKRISIINWIMILPLFILFSGPYIYLADYEGIDKVVSYPGGIFFSVPFMITILHGHVTMALGEAHRHHYYSWLDDQTFTYGLLFHPVMMRTRFRLVFLMVSLLLFITGYLLAV